VLACLVDAAHLALHLADALVNVARLTTRVV
jgi:hypothetical protein